MNRISTVDLIRNFSVHGDEAMSKPVIVTKNDRDRLVLISIEQYGKLKQAYDSLRGQYGRNASEYQNGV